MQRKGVDISEMNGAVDFQALKRAGVEFVLIRCGYGNDTTQQDDKRFAENVRKAETAGIPWGAYLYSYAVNTDMAESEAWHMLRLLAGRKPAYGVWYDLEDKSQAGADLVSIADTFCKAMEKAGLYVGIYAFVAWMNSKLNSSRLDRYDKWVAQVYDKCEYKKPYGIWQYSHSGVIGGKTFDMNYAYKDYPALTGKKEEPELTKAEIQQIAREEYARLNPTYNTIDQIPSYWRADIKELVEKGAISGVGGGKLGLTHSECKAAVIAKHIIELAPGEGA